MKNKFNILFSTLLAVLAMVGCTEEIVKPELPVQKIDLSDLTKAMFIGETHQMTATVKPENHAADTIAWTSSDALVASIDETGLITALAEGTTLICATVKNVTAQCEVKVSPVLVESVTLNKTELNMETSGALSEAELIAVVNPENASDKTVTWSIEASPAGCVTVENGKVTAHEVGTAVITAKAGNKEAACNVVVIGSEPVMMPPTLELSYQGTGTLKVTLPFSMVGSAVTWTSADPTKATVEASADDDCVAVVTAIGFGEVVIKAEVGGKTLESTVIIAPRISLNFDDFTPETLKAEIKKYNDMGVRQYVLSGDLKKSGMAESTTSNPFFGTDVEEIDFSGVTTGWVPTKIVISTATTTAPGPAKWFNNKDKANPNGFPHLKKVVFPEAVEALGRFTFNGVTTLEEVVAPGVQYLHKDSFGYCSNLKKLSLTTTSKIVYGPNAGESPFNNAKVENYKTNATLVLSTVKKDEVNGNSYLGVEWKEIVFE